MRAVPRFIEPHRAGPRLVFLLTLALAGVLVSSIPARVAAQSSLPDAPPDDPQPTSAPAPEAEDDPGKKEKGEDKENPPERAPDERRSPRRIATSPGAGFRAAVAELRREGRTFERTGRLEQLNPDFNERFEHPVTPEYALKGVLEPQHASDEIIDAYVRWQLLSFEPDFSTLELDAFRRFINRLPRLRNHPAAAPRLHEQFDRLAELSGRNAGVRDRLRERWDALRIEIRRYDVLMKPSLKFRDAVYDMLPRTGPFRPIFLLYDLRDRIRVGLSTRGVKSRLTRELKRRRLDESLSAGIRWELIKQIEAMEKDDQTGSTRVLRDITFYTRSPAKLHYSTKTVRSTDAKKWTAYLNRIDP